MEHGQRAGLVVEDEQLLVGLVTVADVKDVPSGRWSLTPLAQIMSHPPLATAAPTTNLADALELMVARGVHQLPVLDGSRIAGMITRAEILQLLQIRTELDSRALHGTEVTTAGGVISGLVCVQAAARRTRPAPRFNCASAFTSTPSARTGT
ncbi:MAG TPA: CBS domain-containing protein [Chloroflexota bacterium]